jgi:hypothetical protein
MSTMSHPLLPGEYLIENVGHECAIGLGRSFDHNVKPICGEAQNDIDFVKIVSTFEFHCYSPR